MGDQWYDYSVPVVSPFMISSQCILQYQKVVRRRFDAFGDIEWLLDEYISYLMIVSMTVWFSP